MNTLERIGRRIRHARERAGMTQAVLADKLGCDRVNVSLWESGTNGINMERIAPLCRTLRISSDWLLGLAKK